MELWIFMGTGSYVRVPNMTLAEFESAMEAGIMGSNFLIQQEARLRGNGTCLRVEDYRGKRWSLRVDKISHAVEHEAGTD